ncbi:hypothetical protein WAX46_08860 [Bacillus sp. FJAT-53060]|uniref:hypothetical protein n=1 Tax=Bacillus TaxID=1386 RepID=UPI001CFBDC61|nr:hypothetical protein [Bacillus stratosphericus]
MSYLQHASLPKGDEVSQKQERQRIGKSMRRRQQTKLDNYMIGNSFMEQSSILGLVNIVSSFSIGEQAFKHRNARRLNLRSSLMNFCKEIVIN